MLLQTYEKSADLSCIWFLLPLSLPASWIFFFLSGVFARCGEGSNHSIFQSCLFSSVLLYQQYNRTVVSGRRHDMTSVVPALWRHLHVLIQIDCFLSYRHLAYRTPLYSKLHLPSMDCDRPRCRLLMCKLSSFKFASHVLRLGLWNLVLT